jgi:hypothetical protein
VVPVLREHGYVPTDIAARLGFTCHCEDPHAMGLVNHPAITAGLRWPLAEPLDRVDARAQVASTHAPGGHDLWRPLSFTSLSPIGDGETGETCQVCGDRISLCASKGSSTPAAPARGA